MNWNRVVTVEDFWDRPRGGFAFQGECLVAYKCLWDGEVDDYSDWYAVKKVKMNLLPLVEESWAIWKRWERAFHSGATNRKTHPALPEDLPRYEELRLILDPIWSFDEVDCERAKAEFRSASTKSEGLQVCWTV